MPDHWSATLYVLFELCAINAEGVIVDDEPKRPLWVQPSSVSAISNIRRVPTIGCSSIWIQGSRLYVVGSPPEVYQKLTEPRDYQLRPPTSPKEIPRRP